MEEVDAELLPAVSQGANLAIVQQQQDEMKMLVTMANQFPRNPEKALDAARSIILMDPETAEDSYYVLPAPQGGKEPIIGPSIRMAEIIAQQWGRVVFEARLVEESEKTITVIGRCMDLQTMTVYQETLTRSVWSAWKQGKPGPKEGRRYSQSVVINTIRAAQAIVSRNCILKIVPRAYANRLVREAMAIVEGKEKSLEERREAALQYGEKMGLSQADMLAYAGVQSVMELGPDGLRKLRGGFTAVKDGVLSIDDMKVRVEKSEVKIEDIKAAAGEQTHEPPKAPAQEKPKPAPTTKPKATEKAPEKPKEAPAPEFDRESVMEEIGKLSENIGAKDWNALCEEVSPFESNLGSMPEESLLGLVAKLRGMQG